MESTNINIEQDREGIQGEEVLMGGEDCIAIALLLCVAN